MIKAIMFDFDGTLTYKGTNTWKAIWIELGYDINDPKSNYYSQMQMYFDNIINYQGWCDVTAQSFKNKHMHKSIMNNIINRIKLVDGLTEFLSTLKSKGISLNIVSGNFVDVIKQSLKDNVQYFDTINANELVYDNQGYLTHIKGTNYDYEGKAQFIKEYCTTHNIKPSEVCFVGNGDNDEWAHISGCKTICINPDNTNHTDTTKWHMSIPHLTNMTQLLPLLLNK